MIKKATPPPFGGGRCFLLGIGALVRQFHAADETGGAALPMDRLGLSVNRQCQSVVVNDTGMGTRKSATFAGFGFDCYEEVAERWNRMRSKKQAICVLIHLFL